NKGARDLVIRHRLVARRKSTYDRNGPTCLISTRVGRFCDSLLMVRSRSATAADTCGVAGLKAKGRHDGESTDRRRCVHRSFGGASVSAGRGEGRNRLQEVRP